MGGGAGCRRGLRGGAFFEGLGGGEEGAEAGLLHGFGDELELAAGFVDGERAGDADGVAVFGAEAEEGGLAAEEDDGELGFGVLEGEVAVAAGGGTPVGDFAFDGDVAVGALDEVADVADEVADGEDVLRGCCGEGGGFLSGFGRESAGRRRFEFGGGGALRERDCSARMSAGVTSGVESKREGSAAGLGRGAGCGRGCGGGRRSWGCRQASLR